MCMKIYPKEISLGLSDKISASRMVTAKSPVRPLKNPKRVAASAYARNIVVSDDTAAPHQITPRLLSIMQVLTKRNGGGNMNSSGFKLTDLYIGPEAAASMRSTSVAKGVFISSTSLPHFSAGKIR